MTHKSKWRNENSYNNKIKESIRYSVRRIISIYITADRMNNSALALLPFYFVVRLNCVVLVYLQSALYLAWLSNMKWWSLISIANQNRALVAFALSIESAKTNGMNAVFSWKQSLDEPFMLIRIWNARDVVSLKCLFTFAKPLPSKWISEP